MLLVGINIQCHLSQYAQYALRGATKTLYVPEEVLARDVQQSSGPRLCPVGCPATLQLLPWQPQHANGLHLHLYILFDIYHACTYCVTPGLTCIHNWSAATLTVSQACDMQASPPSKCIFWEELFNRPYVFHPTGQTLEGYVQLWQTKAKETSDACNARTHTHTHTHTSSKATHMC